MYIYQLFAGFTACTAAETRQKFLSLLLAIGIIAVGGLFLRLGYRDIDADKTIPKNKKQIPKTVLTIVVVPITLAIVFFAWLNLLVLCS